MRAAPPQAAAYIVEGLPQRGRAHVEGLPQHRRGRAKITPKMAPKRGLTPFEPRNLTPAPFYLNFIGSGPLGALAPHPNGQKGSEKAQQGQKWLKMTKNGPVI